MPRVLITGGPGAGKTTLLAELARRGHAICGDSARGIIVARRSQGLSARPEPQAFALQILHQDMKNYETANADAGWVFYERGVVDALGMALESAALPEPEIARLLSEFAYHPLAFVLPPWEAIYTQDSERDQSFPESVAVHSQVVRWIARCGYKVAEVPKATVRERADHVLQQLATASPDRIAQRFA